LQEKAMTFPDALEKSVRQFIASGDGRPLERRRAVRLLNWLAGTPDTPQKQRILRRMERHAEADVRDGLAEGEYDLPLTALQPVGIDWSVVLFWGKVLLSILGLLLLFI
jgi:hypothetical protein